MINIIVLSVLMSTGALFASETELVHGEYINTDQGYSYTRAIKKTYSMNEPMDLGDKNINENNLQDNVTIKHVVHHEPVIVRSPGIGASFMRAFLTGVGFIAGMFTMSWILHP
ncbi:MAG TPA: hypothetical protein VFF04_06075 [Candidatus Babeliales bacterium]|nr:hypothetical protein [Candidatus Babeliales bacterium]